MRLQPPREIVLIDARIASRQRLNILAPPGGPITREMSYSDYLWTVARALRERVHADVATDEARETVQNCVRVLTALANALERDAPPGVPRPGFASDDVSHCVVREAMGPPENPALHLATEAVIADVAARIDRGLLTEPTIVDPDERSAAGGRDQPGCDAASVQ